MTLATVHGIVGPFFQVRPVELSLAKSTECHKIIRPIRLNYCLFQGFHLCCFSLRSTLKSWGRSVTLTFGSVTFTLGLSPWFSASNWSSLFPRLVWFSVSSICWLLPPRELSLNFCCCCLNGILSYPDQWKLLSPPIPVIVFSSWPRRGVSLSITLS